MFLVLLTSWLPLLPDHRYHVIEFFAGKGRICRLAKAVGLRSCGHEVTYDDRVPMSKSAFNINGDAGFLLLGLDMCCQAACLSPVSKSRAC